MLINKRFIFLAIVSAIFFNDKVNAQPATWHISTYPDEDGFKQRTSGMLAKLAAMPFGERSKFVARCPDTQLTFYTWALEGEEIISPYTGRKFVQIPTGYFGAKQRDSLGRLTDLRCSGTINNKTIVYSTWANGAVYESPYVKIKGGLMQFIDGKAGYLIDCRGERPVFSTLKQ